LRALFPSAVGRQLGSCQEEGPLGRIAPSSRAPQHLTALNRANRVRSARAELKRRIASGHTSVPQVLGECPWHAATMSVSDLLMSQRWWGRARCRRLLLTIGVPEGKPVGNLTERQRTEMATVLAVRSGVSETGAPTPPPHARSSG
jgi:hypothetical protein